MDRRRFIQRLGVAAAALIGVSTFKPESRAEPIIPRETIIVDPATCPVCFGWYKPRWYHIPGDKFSPYDIEYKPLDDLNLKMWS